MFTRLNLSRKSHWRRPAGRSLWRKTRNYGANCPSRPDIPSRHLSGNPLAMTAGYETISSLDHAAYEEMNKKIRPVNRRLQTGSRRIDVPLAVNRAGSMFGVFFTNQEVTDFASAQSSDLDYFAKYYRVWRKRESFCRHPNLKDCSYRQPIPMKILKKRLRQSVKHLLNFKNNILVLPESFFPI